MIKCSQMFLQQTRPHRTSVMFLDKYYITPQWPTPLLPMVSCAVCVCHIVTLHCALELLVHTHFSGFCCTWKIVCPLLGHVVGYMDPCTNNTNITFMKIGSGLKVKVSRMSITKATVQRERAQSGLYLNYFRVLIFQRVSRTLTKAQQCSVWCMKSLTFLRQFYSSDNKKRKSEINWWIEGEVGAKRVKKQTGNIATIRVFSGDSWTFWDKQLFVSRPQLMRGCSQQPVSSAERVSSCLKRNTWASGYVAGHWSG